uniref:DUF1618 domain-containing protein n=1 Tax=Arundo donax TaxID=35708 RepID=A0A0A9C5W0_ARUDO
MTGARSYFPPPRHVQLEYPMAGGRTYFMSPHSLVEPPCLRAALVCAVGAQDDDDCRSRPFRVVLLFPNHGTMFATVYSSQNGAWGDVTAANGRWSSIGHWEPNSVLVRDELYWPEGHVEYRNLGSQHSPPRRVEIPDHSSKMFGYDLETNWLLHVKGLEISHDDPYDCLQVFRDEYGELGLAAVRGSRLLLFELVAADDYEDTSAWSEYRDFDLDALLPPSMGSSPQPVTKRPVGFDEDGNKIFLETENGVFALQLESLKVNKVLDAGVLRPYRSVETSTMTPYMSFFVAGGSGRDDGVNDGAAHQQ